MDVLKGMWLLVLADDGFRSHPCYPKISKAARSLGRKMQVCSLCGFHDMTHTKG